MNFTDEQAETLAVCSCCQCELDADQIRAGMEAGVTPPQFLCPECGKSEERRRAVVFQLGLQLVGELMAGRLRDAGLLDHYGGIVRERLMRLDNRQN